MPNQREQLCIENAHIMLRNFSGRGGRYNNEGDRSFAVRLDDPMMAQQLANDGWNVRNFIPKSQEGNPDAEPINYIRIAVSFKPVPGIRPLEVYMITGNRKVRLYEDTIGELDYDDILYADLIINPHPWTTASGSGIKGYLAKAYITVACDQFQQKYEQFEEVSRPGVKLADD